MTIAFAGGDARTVAAVSELIKAGYTVRTFGVPECLEYTGLARCENIGECFEGAEAAVLPFPAFRNGRLSAAVINTPPREDEVFGAAKDMLVIGGGIGRGERREDYSLREEYVSGNAEITAEGAVNVLMNELKITLNGGRFLVAGYGRIGKRVAEKLKRLGGGVTVAARSEAARADAAADGFAAAGFESVEAPLGRVCAVINTVPARVFGMAELASLRRGAIFLELASAPGGADREAAESIGLNYVAAPGLPGKYAPETAGFLLAETVKSILRERGI